jgi:hypothetical protein
MFGEYPVRPSVTPIASATEAKRCLKISRRMGSVEGEVMEGKGT